MTMTEWEEEIRKQVIDDIEAVNEVDNVFRDKVLRVAREAEDLRTVQDALISAKVRANRNRQLDQILAAAAPAN
ncbi:MAG: hypothetical protein ACHQVK_00960 [Candidatus Paceibacterales bacterium]